MDSHQPRRLRSVQGAGRNCFMAFPPNAISYHAVRFDPPASMKQERPVIRGFIREGSNTQNWIRPKEM